MIRDNREIAILDFVHLSVENRPNNGLSLHPTHANNLKDQVVEDEIKDFSLRL